FKSQQTSISVPDSGVANPYPATLSIAGLPGTITHLSVVIERIHHDVPDDLDLLLVGPHGEKVILMSDAGGSTAPTQTAVRFDDAATRALPDSSGISGGGYRPTNYGRGDSFPAPAPGGPGGGTVVALNRPDLDGT